MASSSGDFRERIAEIWWRGYARCYDWMWSGTLADLVSAAIPASAPPDRCRIVDAGTGTGLIARRLAEIGPVIGIDRSRAMLARAARHPGTWVLADVCRPPIRPATVDLVVAANLLHLCPQPVCAITALAALVRPGGRFIMTWPPDEVGIWRLAQVEYAHGARLVTTAARLAVRVLVAVTSLAARTARRTPSGQILSAARTLASNQDLRFTHQIGVEGLQHIVVLAKPITSNESRS